MNIVVRVSDDCPPGAVMITNMDAWRRYWSEKDQAKRALIVHEIERSTVAVVNVGQTT